MDIEGTIRAAARWALVEEARRAARGPRRVRQEEALPYVSEIKRLLTGLGVGVLNVELVGGLAGRGPDDGDVDLQIVFDDGWEPLDEGWDPEDSMAAMFNALESQGFRHVPGTSGFDGGSTAFVRDGVLFDFTSPHPPS